MVSLAVRLLQPVDVASIAIFRIAFGLVMVWEVWRYFSNGWIRRYWIDPDFHFKYFGFDWVHPWPGDLMEAHFAVLGLLAACVALGLFYRLAAALFFVGFTYVFLLDQARYLNHFYLICLLSFLMSFVPAHHALSVDALRRPELASQRVPAWALWLLRLQIGTVYTYAGIAKLNPDWLRGEPMRTWLASRTEFPVIGPLFTQEPVVYLASYGALALDLFVVPLLLWRPTRPWAFAAACSFHVLNAGLFTIGIFPWLMIAATTLFFDPSWPRLGFWPRPADLGSSERARLTTRQQVLFAGLSLYVAVQFLVPLRHWLYPGEVSWTEEGHRFAWHMLLRTKSADVAFFATDPATGTSWQLDPRKYVTPGQENEMRTRPDMILQLAHHMASDLRAKGSKDVQIRAGVTASLNGRPEQVLIDGAVDLAAVSRSLAPAAWIVPLDPSLPRTRPPSSPAPAQSE